MNMDIFQYEKRKKKKKLLVGGVGLETSVTCVHFLLLVRGGSYDIFHQSCSSLIIDKSARER